MIIILFKHFLCSIYLFWFIEGLNKLESVKFIRCKNLQDFGLEIMGRHVATNLSHLTIDSCPKISEFGLKHLESFT